MSQISAKNILSAFRERTEARLSTGATPGKCDSPIIDCFDELPSTNRHLMDCFRKAATERIVRACVADIQTDGVGRQGRRWQSTGQSITFSVLLPLELTVDRLGGLSLAIGIAVIEYLQSVVTQPLALKWPNDVLAGQRKLCGILIESPGNAQGPLTLVVGIGVNYSGVDELKPMVNRPLVTLEHLLQEDALKLSGDDNIALGAAHSRLVELPSRDWLIGCLLADVLSTIHEFNQAGWQAFATRFASVDALFGHRVSVSHGAEQIKGIARGVADNGNLLVEVSGTLESFAAGDVSLSHVRS